MPKSIAGDAKYYMNTALLRAEHEAVPPLKHGDSLGGDPCVSPDARIGFRFRAGTVRIGIEDTRRA